MSGFKFEFVQKKTIGEILDDDPIEIPEIKYTFRKDLLTRTGTFKEAFPKIKKARDAPYKGKSKDIHFGPSPEDEKDD